VLISSRCGSVQRRLLVADQIGADILGQASFDPQHRDIDRVFDASLHLLVYRGRDVNIIIEIAVGVEAGQGGCRLKAVGQTGTETSGQTLASAVVTVRARRAAAAKMRSMVVSFNAGG
jgi:hypothetical protein